MRRPFQHSNGSKKDTASSAKSARPELDKLLAHVRAGDTVVIWKLDRLGRSLKHLVEPVGELAELKVGLQSLNDAIDTTHAQGRLVFNPFASLTEFERELIRERTQAGLSAARAQGRTSRSGSREECPEAAWAQNGNGSLAVRPPSTTITWPVIKAAASLARKTTTLPISCGSPVRPTGCSLSRPARA